ncbi:MAG: hypothetical protein M0Z77_08035 [Thermoplasmatales archaeon]|nr:hypothetical protein [Thermoplasmatales archaeon]
MKLPTYDRRATKIHETLYVALPKDWVKANKVQRYSDIKLELMTDGSLRVRAAETDMEIAL